MILPPLVFPGGMLRACPHFLLRVHATISPSSPVRERDKEREREGEREREREKEGEREGERGRERGRKRERESDWYLDTF